MSGALDLYCALLDIKVPPEKARAVVDALAAPSPTAKPAGADRIALPAAMGCFDEL